MTLALKYQMRDISLVKGMLANLKEVEEKEEKEEEEKEEKEEEKEGKEVKEKELQKIFQELQVCNLHFFMASKRLNQLSGH